MLSKKRCACHMVALALLATPTLAVAQKPGSPGKSPPHPAAGNFESNGLKATIVSVAKVTKGFSVQLLITDTRSNAILVSPISSADSNGSGNTAMSASGARFMIDGNGRSIVGMEPCYSGVYQITFAAAVSGCVKSFPIENMTKIEPGQTALLGITYVGAGDPGANVSFGLKFLVREVVSKGEAPDALSDKPAVSSGPPTLSSVSFALVPLPEAGDTPG